MAKDREFLNRRLHSLLGIIPVGLFLVEHLLVNHFATRGASAFNAAANFMANLPFVHFLEVFLIFLPLLYHAVYGLYIAFTAKNNVSRFGYFRNWMFLLQRVTGIITLIFVVWHVWQTRIAAAFGAEVNFDMMTNILDNPAMLVFYIVGVLSAVFHFSNGLWSFFVSWGLTITPRSQQVSTYVTMGIFVLISIVAMRALFAFLDPQLANL
ncbi:succinate dehydrogenase cytochrome b558 subunit [Calidifontibacillus erzurumensis]|uniref:Succinate dehydrogenase n=1 Tax=Calidifontibacillus erzurumensis TaxID=2741433 RepID=A0A8J8GDV0_9BACI|nr:succinate dehydrogenase cytochrome b558 subunit [Calidifontibacillus erzurumensis]NSL51552.1 succinate dehydrogenase [Calidifontibacillus erzurumensis]